jgi:large subunit ribosomal protein L13
MLALFPAATPAVSKAAATGPSRFPAMTKTTLATEADRQTAMATWRVVDASGQVLGRLAARIAEILMGKHLPTYTPHMLVGEGVIVINAGKVKVTGNKQETREYTYYTGFPGGLRKVKLGDYLAGSPEHLIQLAVRRMLPKNRLARRMLSRLKVYEGATHPHVAQKPSAI